MMQLSNLFTLNHQVALYVPSTQGLSGKISAQEHEARRNLVARQLTNLFGGATSQKAQGYYKANNGELVVETIYIVEAYTSDSDLEAKSQELISFTQTQCREWDQESLLLEIDNNAHFIEQ